MSITPEPIPPLGDMGLVFPLASRPKLPRNRQTIAIHEAGHAAVAIALGLPVHGARITDSAGGFSMEPSQSLERIGEKLATEDRSNPGLLPLAMKARPSSGLRQNALDLTTMLAAGLQAEILFADLPWPGLLCTHDSDGISARACMAGVFGGAYGIAWTQRRARALLTQHWDTVQSIAGSLDTCGWWFHEPHQVRPTTESPSNDP